MEWLRMEHWSPYIVGMGIGILSWLSFLLSDTYIGCSGAFSKTTGMIEKLFKGKKVGERAYYRKIIPQVDWEWMLVVGVFIGAFISARLSGQFEFQWVPPYWHIYVNSSPFIRWVVACIGGILVGFGSRWAGGCTSGHGISGTLQLAVSSWVAVIGFFVGGVITAMLIFKIILT